MHADNFLYVSPTRNYFNTADAAVIDQITKRRHDFPKPIEVYGSLNIYGQNVVSTEGDLWKHHRKTVSPPFNEKNNRMVWHESLRQAQSMINGWMVLQTQSSASIYSVANDCMRLSLHVISCAGFGVNLDWPSAKDEGNQALANGHDRSSDPDTEPRPSEISGDHKMSYVDALQTLLHNMIWILILPLSLLKWIPISSVQRSYTSYTEWGKHLRELFAQKKADISQGKSQEGMDLMGFLCKAAGLTSNSTKEPEKPQSKPTFSDDDIMGNAFVFLLAGHETAANSIHFSCLYLAMHPASQRRLQKSLDHIFASRPVSEWDYERDFTALFSTMAGAVLAEELRLIPPVPAIPK
ncbi:MAG: hypothetical protein Q9168_004954, partial [Polycauliona sp. 1 TL-2023]